VTRDIGEPYRAEDGQPQAAASTSSAPTANTWQLDFCSRPILDERGKKVWELLICDETRTFEFSRYFPNNKINSTQVNATLSCSHLQCVRCASCVHAANRHLAQIHAHEVCLALIFRHDPAHAVIHGVSDASAARQETSTPTRCWCVARS